MTIQSRIGGNLGICALALGLTTWAACGGGAGISADGGADGSVQDARADASPDAAVDAGSPDAAPLLFDCEDLPTSPTSLQIIPGARGYHGVAFDEEGHIIGTDANNLLKVTYAGSVAVLVPGMSEVQYLATLPDGDIAVVNDEVGAIQRVYSTGATTNIVSGLDVHGLTVGPDGMLYAAGWGGVYRVDPVANTSIQIIPPADWSWRVVNFNLDNTKMYLTTLSDSGNVYAVDLDGDLNPIGPPYVFAPAVKGPGTAWQDGCGVDACGNVYVPEYWSHSLYRITPDGEVSVLHTFAPDHYYGHAVSWGSGIGGWNPLAVYMPQPYNENTVVEVVIGVPAKSMLCGNGTLDDGEDCDDGGESATCDRNCTHRLCGDGTINATSGETCDDGAIGPGDGCDASCRTEAGYLCTGQPSVCEEDCGDGDIVGSEDCDDAGESPTCDTDCTVRVCGDNTVNATADEQCDDSNLGSGSCFSLGYAGGTLLCDGDCHFDTTECGGPLTIYLFESFEDPTSVAQWTLTGDWQVGTPSTPDEPSAPYSGLNVAGTVVGGDYSDNMAYLDNMAISPTIDLTGAVAPTLRFFGTVQSNSNNDCGNIWIRSGTEPWAHQTASLPYTGTHASYDCWMGMDSPDWQEITVDLSSYVDSSIQVAFAYRTDVSGTYPGFYIDDVLVSEPVP